MSLDLAVFSLSMRIREQRLRYIKKVISSQLCLSTSPVHRYFLIDYIKDAWHYKATNIEAAWRDFDENFAQILLAGGTKEML